MILDAARKERDGCKKRQPHQREISFDVDERDVISSADQFQFRNRAQIQCQFRQARARLKSQRSSRRQTNSTPKTLLQFVALSNFRLRARKLIARLRKICIEPWISSCCNCNKNRTIIKCGCMASLIEILFGADPSARARMHRVACDDDAMLVKPSRGR